MFSRIFVYSNIVLDIFQMTTSEVRVVSCFVRGVGAIWGNSFCFASEKGGKYTQNPNLLIYYFVENKRVRVPVMSKCSGANCAVTGMNMRSTKL